MDYAIHYGVDTMTKKKVWMSFWVVMILLLTCTVLSLWIEKMMRIEVVTMPGLIDEKTNKVSFLHLMFLVRREIPCESLVRQHGRYKRGMLLF